MMMILGSTWQHMAHGMMTDPPPYLSAALVVVAVVVGQGLMVAI